MSDLLRSGVTYWFDFNGEKVGLELNMLTPEWAQDLLDNYNRRNRPISESNVAKYARDIADGLWPFTGESIIIGEDGQMHNGQNRCKAVVKANKAIPVLIVYNVANDSMSALDQLKPRSVGDILQTVGPTVGQKIPNDTIVSATARLLMTGHKDLWKYTDNRQRIAAYVQAHFDVLVENAAWARSIHTDSPALEGKFCTSKERKAIAPAAVGALALIMESRGGDKLDVRAFFEKIVGQKRADNDTEHVSINAVKYFITKNTTLTYGGANKFPTAMMVFETLITAYNRIQKGVPVKKVTPRSGDSARWFDNLPAVENRGHRETI